MQNLPDLVCFLVYNVFVKGPFSIFYPVKTVLRYFKHTFDKTNNNVNFFSHFFSQSNRYEHQPPLPLHQSMRISKYSLLPFFNIWLEQRQSTQRLKMENDTTGGSQHLQSACFSGFSPRQSCNVSFILLQCCCCNPHFLSCGCPRMRIQQTLPVVMFPPSFNPQCSSSICHLEKCSATHTHTHTKSNPMANTDLHKNNAVTMNVNQY